jgi:hypothetical protein
MPIENATPDLSPTVIQRQVLWLLAEEQPLWSPADLGREINDRIGAIDAIAGLRRGGLVYSTSDGFVFASYAGVRAIEIIGSGA